MASLKKMESSPLYFPHYFIRLSPPPAPFSPLKNPSHKIWGLKRKRFQFLNHTVTAVKKIYVITQQIILLNSKRTGVLCK